MADYINVQRYAPYQEERMQQLYNTLFGYTPEGGDPVKGLIEKQRPVPAQQMAAFTQPQQDAFALAQQGIGAYAPYLAQAEGVTPYMQQALGAQGQALGYGQAALLAGQQQFAPTAAGIKEYEDPYAERVTQEAIKEMDRQALMAQQQTAAGAIGAGAFGGSRYGVQQAELGRNLQDIKSRRITEDQSRNYQQALQSAMVAQEGASKRQIAAGQQFAGLGQQYGQQAQGYGGLGSMYQTLGQYKTGMAGRDIESLLGIGQQQQAMKQTGLDVARANILAQQQEPYSRVGFGANILQGMPQATVEQAVPAGPLYQQSPFAAAMGAGILGLRGYQGLTGQYPGMGIGNLSLV